jgi:ubiquinone/menaquinone biosynthesis C-methylase UbiE
MEKLAPNFGFKLMSLTFRVRDIFAPRIHVLREAGIRQGYRVLDYGCGPGAYIAPLEKLVGSTGMIHALDVHPLAIREVERIASRLKLANVATIQSNCITGLADGSIDLVLLYDTFHDLEEPNKVLEELHRILIPNGNLSFSDHHMKEADIVSQVTAGNLFSLSSKGPKTYTFRKENRGSLPNGVDSSSEGGTSQLYVF